MSHLTDAERTLHATVEELLAADAVGVDDARYFHDRIDLLAAELRRCREEADRR
jgi:hypothetical protein